MKTLQLAGNELEASLNRIQSLREGILESLAFPNSQLKSVPYDIEVCPDCKTPLSEPYKGELTCNGCGNTFI